MTAAPLNILFLCTGNSARSIMAEAILAREGRGKMRAYSAGSRPAGQVHPLARALLAETGHDISHLRSKSWDEFAAPGAPVFDFIFTVCDNAANETCPVMPGRAPIIHWGAPDPAAVQGSAARRRAAFRSVYDLFVRRIAALVALPIENLEGGELLKRLREIGHIT